MKGTLFIVSGPSCAGKTSLVQAVVQEADCHIQIAVGYTTRPMRPDEQLGNPYQFITQKEFTEKIENKFFIDWRYIYGAYYGTPKTLLDDLVSGASYILVASGETAQHFKQLYSKAVLIWIQPSSMQEIERRLLKRGDTLAQRVLRLKESEIALKEEEENPVYDYHIINDSFQDALAELKKIVCF